MPTSSSNFDLFQASVSHKTLLQPPHSLDTDVERKEVDLPVLRKRLSEFSQQYIGLLDESLSEFSHHFRAHGNSIRYASDFNDLFLLLDQLLDTLPNDSVSLPQTNLSPALSLFLSEIGLPQYLLQQGISNAATATTRIFVAEHLWADQGLLQIPSLSPESMRALNTKGTNLFIAPITALCPNQREFEIFRNGDPTEDMSAISLSTQGPSKARNILIIIDNTRTALLEQPTFRNALACIRCGRCAQVCPVTRIVSHKAYDNVYVGPIAHIQLPFFEPLHTVIHLPYACTLCGRCEQVCPLSLPLPQWHVQLRKYLWDNDLISKKTRREVAKMYRTLDRQKRSNDI